MPTVLQIVHGYPPRELAGTEMATARLVRGLEARGWRCQVFAATRAPGMAQYTLLEDEPGVTRIVNNLPFRPLAELERDRVAERAIADALRAIRPDVVHVQHLAFLSSGLRFPIPAVGTLHDHWPWCVAGGTMLREGKMPCPGPEPATCVRCYARTARLPGRVERGAVSIAERLAPWVAPPVLHRHWRRLPVGIRARLRGPSATPGSPADVEARNQALIDAWRALDVRMAPSAFLAREAERYGLGPVEVVPAGLAAGAPHRGGGPLVFLGSVLPHKGPHLVVQAYRLAFGAPPEGPGLEIHGDPSGDPAYAHALAWPLAGRLAPEEVPDVLRDATALVLGSTWPENAPLVILEARAAGCPVIAPRIGGIPELVEDGLDGLLYEAGDVEALASLLARIATPGGHTGLRVRPPPTPEAHLDRLEAIYHAAIAAHARREP